jgi:hypothetical protein
LEYAMPIDDRDIDVVRKSAQHDGGKNPVVRAIEYPVGMA